MYAGVAQLAERDPSKFDVEGSSPFARSEEKEEGDMFNEGENS
jgi:hypothetical protein